LARPLEGRWARPTVARPLSPLLRQAEGAVAHFDQDAGALVYAVVIVGAIAVDGIGAHDFDSGIDGVAQGGAELGRTRLGLLYRHADGGVEQSHRVPGVARERRDRTI